ncbi:MAG: hypothetical protein RJA22_1850 [Verrucomicrobiota bacterium]
MKFQLLPHRLAHPLALALFAVIGLLGTTPLRAQPTNVVLMGNYFYTPSILNISAGDYVRWTNTTVTQHDTHQNTNLWDSPLLALGGNFTLRFTNAGFYPYYCTPHIGLSQTGSVTVVNPVTNIVLMGNYFFNPAVLTIGLGDYVRWTNTTVTQHDSHQNTNFWDGPLVSLGGNYDLRLTTPGFYPYYCTPHINLSQTGSVTVTLTANQPPVAALTSPANGAALAAPASITLTATASDSDGTVAKVEFFSSQTKLGEDTAAPYSFTWTNVAAGNYSLTARAIDSLGATGNSTAISLSVTNAPPQPVTLSSTAWNGSDFSFSFASESGRPYQVQFRSGAGAGNWQVLTNLTGTGSTLTVTDRNPATTTRFYRVQSQ